MQQRLAELIKVQRQALFSAYAMETWFSYNGKLMPERLDEHGVGALGVMTKDVERQRQEFALSLFDSPVVASFTGSACRSVCRLVTACLRRAVLVFVPVVSSSKFRCLLTGGSENLEALILPTQKALQNTSISADADQIIISQPWATLARLLSWWATWPLRMRVVLHGCSHCREKPTYDKMLAIHPDISAFEASLFRCTTLIADAFYPSHPLVVVSPSAQMSDDVKGMPSPPKKRKSDDDGDAPAEAVAEADRLDQKHSAKRTKDDDGKAREPDASVQTEPVAASADAKAEPGQNASAPSEAKATAAAPPKATALAEAKVLLYPFKEKVVPKGDVHTIRAAKSGVSGVTFHVELDGFDAAKEFTNDNTRIRAVQFFTTCGGTAVRQYAAVFWRTFQIRDSETVVLDGKEFSIPTDVDRAETEKLRIADPFKGKEKKEADFKSARATFAKLFVDPNARSSSAQKQLMVFLKPVGCEPSIMNKRSFADAFKSASQFVLKGSKKQDLSPAQLKQVAERLPRSWLFNTAKHVFSMTEISARRFDELVKTEFEKIDAETGLSAIESSSRRWKAVIKWFNEIVRARFLLDTFLKEEAEFRKKLIEDADKREGDDDKQTDISDYFQKKVDAEAEGRSYVKPDMADERYKEQMYRVSSDAEGAPSQESQEEQQFAPTEQQYDKMRRRDFHHFFIHPADMKILPLPKHVKNEVNRRIEDYRSRNRTWLHDLGFVGYDMSGICITEPGALRAYYERMFSIKKLIKPKNFAERKLDGEWRPSLQNVVAYTVNGQIEHFSSEKKMKDFYKAAAMEKKAGIAAENGVFMPSSLKHRTVMLQRDKACYYLHKVTKEPVRYELEKKDIAARDKDCAKIGEEKALKRYGPITNTPASYVLFGSDGNYTEHADMDLLTLEAIRRHSGSLFAKRYFAENPDVEESIKQLDPDDEDDSVKSKKGKKKKSKKRMEIEDKQFIASDEDGDEELAKQYMEDAENESSSEDGGGSDSEDLGGDDMEDDEDTRARIDETLLEFDAKAEVKRFREEKNSDITDDVEEEILILFKTITERDQASNGRGGGRQRPYSSEPRRFRAEISAKAASEKRKMIPAEKYTVRLLKKIEAEAGLVSGEDEDEDELRKKMQARRAKVDGVAQQMKAKKKKKEEKDDKKGGVAEGGKYYGSGGAPAVKELPKKDAMRDGPMRLLAADAVREHEDPEAPLGDVKVLELLASCPQKTISLVDIKDAVGDAKLAAEFTASVRNDRDLHYIITRNPPSWRRIKRDGVLTMAAQENAQKRDKSGKPVAESVYSNPTTVNCVLFGEKISKRAGSPNVISHVTLEGAFDQYRSAYPSDMPLWDRSIDENEKSLATQGGMTLKKLLLNEAVYHDEELFDQKRLRAALSPATQCDMSNFTPHTSEETHVAEQFQVIENATRAKHKGKLPNDKINLQIHIEQALFWLRMKLTRVHLKDSNVDIAVETVRTRAAQAPSSKAVWTLTGQIYNHFASIQNKAIGARDRRTDVEKDVVEGLVGFDVTFSGWDVRHVAHHVRDALDKTKLTRDQAMQARYEGLPQDLRDWINRKLQMEFCKRIGQCMVCLEISPAILATVCGCSSICRTCSDKTSQCPQCRNYLRPQIRVETNAEGAQHAVIKLTSDDGPATPVQQIDPPVCYRIRSLIGDLFIAPSLSGQARERLSEQAGREVQELCRKEILQFVKSISNQTIRDREPAEGGFKQSFKHDAHIMQKAVDVYRQENSKEIESKHKPAVKLVMHKDAKHGDALVLNATWK